jgi:hypothetical protein
MRPSFNKFTTVFLSLDGAAAQSDVNCAAFNQALA